MNGLTVSVSHYLKYVGSLSSEILVQTLLFTVFEKAV